MARECKETGCGKTVNARGWCSMHYSRWKRGQTIDAPQLRTRQYGSCAAINCGKQPLARGFCYYHYRLKRLARDFDNVSECAVANCDGVVHGRGLCTKHYARLRTHGNTSTVLPPPPLRYSTLPYGSPTALASELGISKSGASKLLHRRKARAHKAVYAAVQSGRLIRPASCERCGQSAKVEGHHEDYNKPLEVNWLCRACHTAIHDHSKNVRGAVDELKRWKRENQL